MWGGPCTGVQELEEALGKAETENKCVTEELRYYRLTHPVEYNTNRHLFKMRGISYDEKYENLKSILSDEEDMSHKRIAGGSLPSNADVLSALQPAFNLSSDTPR